MKNWLCLLFIALPGSLVAQSTRDTVISKGIDSSLSALNVRYGVLPNGFKYYVHRNDSTDKVFMRLVVKAGSDQEEADQIELAHLLEHLAFVKTEHFENAWNYFETRGLRLGQDINAITKQDNTNYKLIFPAGNNELIHDGLIFLKDCAHGIVLNESKTDIERNVVIEELRGYDDPASNLDIQIGKLIRPGDFSSNRLASEKILSIKQYKFKRLVDFYREWYRPDLQAIIVSGNLNTDSAEHHIKLLFSEIETSDLPVKPKVSPRLILQKGSFQVVPARYAKETELEFYSVREQVAGTLDSYKASLLEELSCEVMQNRLKEVHSSDKFMLTRQSSKNGGPLITTISGNTDSVKNNIQKAVIEIERILRHGVTEPELADAKVSLLKEYRSRSKVNAEGVIVEDLLNVFLYDKPLSDKRATDEFAENFIKLIEVKDIQNTLKGWIDIDNQQIIATTPEASFERFFTRPMLKDWIIEARKKNIDVYLSVKEETKLMDITGLPIGSIFLEEYIKEIGVTRLLLSNGIQVLIKPLKSNNPENEIGLLALRYGGSLQLSEEDILPLGYGIRLVSASGLGKLSAPELHRFLKGHNVRLTPYLQKEELGIRGRCDPEELEAMFQVLHQYFTAPNGDERAFNNLVVNKGKKENTINDPQNEFYDAISKSIQPNPFDNQEGLKYLTFQNSFNTYKKYFSDPGEFIFVLTGDFPLKEMKTVAARYLGGLPTRARVTNSKKRVQRSNNDKKNVSSRGAVKIIYGARQNKAQVQLAISGSYVECLENKLELSALDKLLRSALRVRLRDVEGGVYFVFVGSSFFHSKYRFDVSFSCDPEKVDKLIISIEEEMNSLMRHNISDDLCGKIILQEKTALIDKLSDPGFWDNYLANQVLSDADLEEIVSYQNRVGKINPALINRAANKYLKYARIDKFILMPEKK